MSALDKMNSADYSKYDKMSTEALEELLCLDVQEPENEALDIETILYITEVINHREKERPSGRFPATDVNAAWNKFRTHYLPYLTDGRSLYDFDDEEKQISTPASAPLATSQVRNYRRFRHAAAVAAIIIAVLVALTVTAYAIGYDFWEAIAKWSKETFTFVSETEVNETDNPNTVIPTENTKFDNLQTALDAYGVTTLLVPRWIPDGLAIEEVVVSESAFNNSIHFQALYSGEQQYLSIYINMFHDANSIDYSTWEKDNVYVTELEIEGTMFYLTENTGDSLIVWWNGPYEGCISGNVSSADLIHMAESIYGGSKNES